MTSLRRPLAALSLALVACLAVPALAQQPAAVNPTASSVKEEQLLDALKGDNAEIRGRVSIPDQKAATLIRPAGREWREFHQVSMHRIGMVAILGMLVLLAAFYLFRGRIRIDAGPAGVTITRFNGFERFVHWLTASCFIVLGLSGLNVTFGRSLLLPLVGPDAFSGFSAAAKLAHNYLALPFVVGVVLIFLSWVKDNLPAAADIAWLARFGGLLGHSHPPAHRFNAGQKGIFWAVVLGGALLAVSGFYLLFPYLAGGVLNLQFWNMVHGSMAMIMVAIILAHIYIGSLGMEGAFDAMGTGEVDLNWAKEHHSLWVEEEIGKGAPVRAALHPAE